MSTSDRNAADTRIAEAVLGILEPGEREGLGDELRQDFVELEEALADVAESLEGMQPGESLRRVVLTALDPLSRFEGLLDRLADFLDLDPSGARQLLDHLAPDDASSWIGDLVNGTRFLHFQGGPARASAHCGLMVMEPNGALPSHSHGGDEWVFVLQGSAQDHRDKHLETGDLAHFSAGSAHLMRCASAEPFVAALVLDQPPDTEPNLVLESNR
jgi:quercetin dioxygenase-like cupin family protein